MNLFTYGTLMVPGIMHRVAGCVLQGVEVTLEGYVRHGVQGEQYPGIIEKAGSTVDGILYLDIGEEPLRRLDSFEGEMYSRESVQVMRKNDGRIMDAMVYVFKPEYVHLLTDSAWDLQIFLQNGKEIFEREYAGYGALPS